ncbi:S1 family peptidase [Streptomyces sp. NPDC048612]|uniref:S1 family peptidase n=1 Tax=Streptomyces sp. NPDC048612 TaxID=3365579 RepID=UPI003720B20E
MNKRLRTGAIATAGVAAVAAAAILLPNANASTDQPAALKTFSAHSATQMATSLKADLEDNGAGWYLDSSKGHLVMNVLSEDDAENVRAKGAVAKVVHNSMTALKSGTRSLRESAAVPGTAWSIDPKTNKIVVTADRTVTGAKMATLTKATDGMGTGMVTVKRSQGEFKRFDGGDAGSAAGGAAGSAAGGAGDAAGGAGDAAGGAGDAAGGAGDAAGGAGDAAGGAGDAAGGAGDGGGGAGDGGQAAGPVGGSAIFGGNARCSLGFNVTVKGAPAFLTAGHCGNDSKTWSADQGGQPIGTVADSQFPKTDFALVSYDDTAAQPQSAVDLGNGSTQEITKAAEAAVGMKVQRSGSTTGLHDGTVTGLDATVNYGNGDIVNGLIQTDVCAEPGDSGGAMFSDDSAVGLTSGGSGDCTAGGETFFQPVTDALKATGAEIGAGGGDNGGGNAAGGSDNAAGGGNGAGNGGAGNAGAGNAGAGNAGAGAGDPGAGAEDPGTGAQDPGAGAEDPGAGAQDPGAAGGDALN